MTIDIKDLDKVLQQAFDASTAVYKERGFQRRIGFGKKPALISVDPVKISTSKLFQVCNACWQPAGPITTLLCT